MAKQIWKPGNMLYPLPAVMVSVADPGHLVFVITGNRAGGGNGLHKPADGFDFRETRAVFLSHDR